MNHQLQRALQDAAWDGDHLSVAALIHHPDVDPARQHSAALLHAAHRGHLRCVELLLPVSDPNARNAEALWRAMKHRHTRVVRLLAPMSDTSRWEGWMWDELPPVVVECLRLTAIADHLGKSHNAGTTSGQRP